MCNRVQWFSYSPWYFCFTALSKWLSVISVTIYVMLSPLLVYKFYVGYRLYLFSHLYSQEQISCFIPSRWCSMIMCWIHYKRRKLLWKSKRETLLPDKFITYLDRSESIILLHFLFVLSSFNSFCMLVALVLHSFGLNE